MASIQGLQVKSLKSYIGMEGVAYQGNLYLNGKKIGFWSQDGNGAVTDALSMERGYSESLLRKIIENTNEDKAELFHDMKVEYSFELFMEDLIVWKLRENEFKKAVKKGFPMLLEITDGYTAIYYKLPQRYTAMSNKDIEKALAKEIKGSKEQIAKNHMDKRDISVLIFRSLENFNIGDPISLEDIQI